MTNDTTLQGRYRFFRFEEVIGIDTQARNVFAGQLNNLLAPGDLLIAISASGNSPNILKAVEVAKQKQARIVGLTGFSGGRLKELADVNVHVPTHAYEQVEDLHLVIAHLLVYCFKRME